MITKEIVNYADAHWSSHQKPVSELSANKKTGRSCVNNGTLMYDLDAIVGLFYSENRKPKSADALYIQNGKIVWLIEFKQGVKHSMMRKILPKAPIGKSDFERRSRRN